MSYEVKIASVTTTPIGKDSATAWNAYRTNANGTVDTVVALSTNLSGDNASPLVDGVLLKLTNPRPGARQDAQQAPAGYQYTPSSSVWSVGKGTDAYDAGVKSVVFPIKGTAYGDLTATTGVGSGTKVRANDLKKVEIRFSSDPAKQQKAYRWLNQVRSAPAITPPRDTSFIPWIKFRGNGFVYQRDYNSITVPFTVWEVDSMDGDPTPQQLNVGFLENNDSLYSSSGRYLGRGKIDGKWEPT